VILSLLLFLLLLLMGMPVVFAIGIAGFVFFLQQPELQLTMPTQLILSETQVFTLLAIPTFVLAGNLMNEAGVTQRLLHFASVLTGHLRGGLAQVSVVLSTLMGGVSGSAIADAAMQARILGPGMLQRGYTRGLVAALQGFTGLIAVAIPPSIGLILYGSIGQVSVGQLFAGGLGMGVVLASLYMLVVSLIARARGYQPEQPRPATPREVVLAFLGSIWAIVFPIVLLLALRGGVFVPSEVGAAAAVYALLVGLLIYRELDWTKLQRALRNTVADVGMISFLIACSALLSYGMKWEMFPQNLSAFLLNLKLPPEAVVALVLVFLLLLGTVLDSTVMIILLTPILVPAMKALGVDLVHFGVLMVMTSAIGLLTPPVGLSMYSVCSILGCTVREYIQEGWPFFLAALGAILLAFFLPGVVTFLPRLLFGG